MIGDNPDSQSNQTFECPFCSREVLTHNRPEHLRTCDSAGEARKIEHKHTLTSTIDAEWRRAIGEE